MKVAAVEARGVLRGDRRGVSRRIPLRQPAEDEGRLHFAQTRDKKLKLVHDQRPLDALRAQIVQCIRVCVCEGKSALRGFPCKFTIVTPFTHTHLKNNAICCNEQVIMNCQHVLLCLKERDPSSGRDRLASPGSVTVVMELGRCMRVDVLVLCRDACF